MVDSAGGMERFVSGEELVDETIEIVGSGGMVDGIVVMSAVEEKGWKGVGG